MKIEPIKRSDFEAVKNLLVENDLPVNDLHDEIVQLFVAKVKNTIAGVIGLENYKSTGLLRSLAVKQQYRNNRIGRKLVDYLTGICVEVSMQELYLLTTTAEKYFEKFGFLRTGRESVPDLIKGTKEFAGICPETAVIMKKEL